MGCSAGLNLVWDHYRYRLGETVWGPEDSPVRLEPRQMMAAHIVGSSTVYQTIQAAVDAAMPGATINVDAGTYSELVTITKPLTTASCPTTALAISPRKASRAFRAASDAAAFCAVG